MIKKLLFLMLCLLYFKSNAQTDSLVQRLFLIGDAGFLQGDKHPVLDWLTKNVNWNDEKNVALFLGDNIYPDGLPDEGDAEYPYTKKVMDYQLNLVKGKKSKAFFVPGNHDWKGGKIGGWERATNQVNYINGLQAPNIQAWPLNGCPGPVPIELNEKVVLVMMDSQWFLHIHDKPGTESACDSRTIDEFAAQLKEIVASHPNQLLVLVMHHPMYTYGVHGGAYSLKQHLFPFADAIKGLYIPLPVLGSVYPLARGLFGSLQDTYHPLYRNMINTIEEVLKDHPNPIAVAGHEHSMQLIVKDSIPYIVAGSAAKLTRLRKGDNSLFSILDYGFSVIEVRKSGKVDVKFYNLQSKDMNAPLFAKEMKAIVPPSLAGSIDTLYPVIGTVQVAANASIKNTASKRFLTGKNYRQEWQQLVNVPMLDLGNEYGGLKPTKQGGGKQTKTLRLADKSGKEWALRSIEKFPDAAIPADLRSPLTEDLVSDGVSGAYPYASLSIPILEKAAGIPTLRRKLVYIPDDPRLDRFRTGFKNTLAILEEREPVGVGKTYNTEELVLRLAKDIDDHVDQKAVLRVRLMDNFIMDFDRHEGQWQWATRDTGKGKIYYPIPRDRDQAFFKSGGLLSTFMRKPWFVPEIQGFRAKAHNIRTFNRPARNFDRFFLNALSANDWEREIDTFLSLMTDDVITTALKQQPQEIQKYSVAEITAKLKERKKYFRAEMMNYYRFISKKVSVVGSNQKELFTINKMEGGKVTVTANKIEKTGAISSKVFERTFEPKVTEELRIYALEDGDSIVVKGDDSNIEIRIIGGPGADDFVSEAKGRRVKVYDATFEENTFTGKEGIDNKNVDDPEVNRYNRLDFKYDYINPGTVVEYNVDDGIYLGVQLEYLKQGFRKEPYGMRQFVQIDRAMATGSLHFRYEADYIKALKNIDLSMRADFKAPVNVTNFFGLGNNTTYDKTKSIQYYRTRYDIGNVSLLAGKQLQSWMRVGVGPAFQYFTLRPSENVGKFVSDVTVNGLNAATLYNNKSYLGAEARLDINSKNNEAMPARGALIKGYARQLFGLNGSSRAVLQTGLDIRIFMSFVPQPRFVLATRFSLGRNFGKYEFQQAQYLSGRENLRGFRRDRFAGRAMAYNNSEVRLKLADFRTYAFPGSLGILGFHDIGRVWAKGESSNKWHNGYGGGIWIAPIKRFVIAGSLAFSKEEKAMPLVSFGFQF